MRICAESFKIDVHRLNLTWIQLLSNQEWVGGQMQMPYSKFRTQFINVDTLLFVTYKS